MRTAIKSKNSKHNTKKELNAGLKEIGATVDLTGVSFEERHQLIAQAAYFRAEQRSFAPGQELEDWLRAEAEVEVKLSQNNMHDLAKNA